MRKGFTMIELIFVIVILGILAAVAVPKLSATRDDAKIATALSEVSTALNDFGSYYTSQGTFAKPNAMTNVLTWDDITKDLNNTTGTINYITKNNSDANESCVSFAFTADGNVTVAASSGTAAGNICKGLQSSSAFTSLKGTKSFGGNRTKF